MNDFKNVIKGTGKVDKFDVYCGKKQTKQQPKNKISANIDFCLNHCPHTNAKCKGDCKEYREKFGGKKNGQRN